MNPPFWGTKVLDAINLDEVVELIDFEQLFSARWQYRKGSNAREWEELKEKRVVPAFERILALCRAKGTLEPKAIYGYFRCRQDGNALVVEGGRKPFRFDFPRERAAPNRCLADFFSDGFVAIQAATVGGAASREGASLFAANSYSDAFLLKGLAAEAAEATAAFVFRKILREMESPDGAGQRFSPGYPVFPNLFDQRKIASLLEITRIGLSLTKTSNLVPEHSTTAIVSIDPRAAIFRP